MTNDSERARDAGLWRDLRALRRYFWLPIAAVAVAVGLALALGAMSDDSGGARFRSSVIVNALPPLFGPAVLPGPFDYAALATSDGVVEEVAAQTGIGTEDLKRRLKAEPRVNTPEIAFTVTGPDALRVTRAWQAAFGAAVVEQTPAIERALVEPYQKQLLEARTRLEAAAAAVAAGPEDAVAGQDLAAAEENYQTAAMLMQSYDVVAETMAAQAFTVKAPHVYGGGPGSTPARIGAAVVLGLLIGSLGALALDIIARRRGHNVYGVGEAPAPIKHEPSSVR